MALELPWSADRTQQQFGRTHRSNEAQPPSYRILLSDVAGETRFASAVAQRLQSLGALTQGDRRAGGGGSSQILMDYNFNDSYGAAACAELIFLIVTKGSYGTEKTGGFTGDSSFKLALEGSGTLLTSNFKPPDLPEEDRRAAFARIRDGDYPYPVGVHVMPSRLGSPTKRKHSDSGSGIGSGGNDVKIGVCSSGSNKDEERTPDYNGAWGVGKIREYEIEDMSDEQLRAALTLRGINYSTGKGRVKITVLRELLRPIVAQENEISSSSSSTSSSLVSTRS